MQHQAGHCGPCVASPGIPRTGRRGRGSDAGSLLPCCAVRFTPGEGERRAATSVTPEPAISPASRRQRNGRAAPSAAVRRTRRQRAELTQIDEIHAEVGRASRVPRPPVAGSSGDRGQAPPPERAPPASRPAPISMPAPHGHDPGDGLVVDLREVIERHVVGADPAATAGVRRRVCRFEHLLGGAPAAALGAYRRARARGRGSTAEQRLVARGPRAVDPPVPEADDRLDQVGRLGPVLRRERRAAATAAALATESRIRSDPPAGGATGSTVIVMEGIIGVGWSRTADARVRPPPSCDPRRLRALHGRISAVVDRRGLGPPSGNVAAAGRPPAPARGRERLLTEALRTVDHVVLLGDSIELRDGPPSEALEVARRPFFSNWARP